MIKKQSLGGTMHPGALHSFQCSRFGRILSLWHI